MRNAASRIIDKEDSLVPLLRILGDGIGWSVQINGTEMGYFKNLDEAIIFLYNSVSETNRCLF